MKKTSKRVQGFEGPRVKVVIQINSRAKFIIVVRLIFLEF